MPAPSVVVTFPQIPRDVVVHRRRGRPRTVGLKPTIEQEAYETQVARLRDEHVWSDPLVEILDPHDDPQCDPQDAPDRTLDLLVQGVAVEAAAIAYEARKAEKKARADAPQMISRRIDALGKLAILVRDRELLRREHGQLDPQQIEQVRRLFLAGVSVAAEVLGPDHGAVFTAQIEALLAQAP